MADTKGPRPAMSIEALAAQAARIMKTSSGARSRARRISSLLTKRDAEGLFHAAGGCADGERIKAPVFARLEALGLVSADRLTRRLSALTDLGYETRDVLRCEYTRQHFASR